MSTGDAERLAAGLVEDEAAANERRGIFPSPVVGHKGSVALHIKRGGNAVILFYDHPESGYGDIADLRAWADTERGWTRARALAEVEAKRRILALYEECRAHPERPGAAAAGIALEAVVSILAGVYTEVEAP